MQYVMKGGIPLTGEVTIGGAKNAALGLLCAAIMTDDTVVIDNLPDVRDTNRLLEALCEIGAQVKRIEAKRDAEVRQIEKERNAEIKKIESQRDADIKAVEKKRDAIIAANEKARDQRVKALEKKRQKAKKQSDKNRISQQIRHET